jgi:hypothetical protein
MFVCIGLKGKQPGIFFFVSVVYTWVCGINLTAIEKVFINDERKKL